MDIRYIENIESAEDVSAAPIIKQIALDVLRSSEGQDVPLRFIRHAVHDITNREFSPGSFSGAMRDLVGESNGRVINPERGIYRYEKSIKKIQINEAIDGLIHSLNEIAIDNILKISDEDLKMIRKIPGIQEGLEKLKI